MGPLDPARTGIAQLRAAVVALGHVRESFLQRFSAAELLKINAAWLASEWDFYPDAWTERQIREALRGVAPRWDAAERPVYTPRARGPK